MDEELWQGYSENGEPVTDRGLTKPECRHGALHGSSHVWIWRKRGENIDVLLQRRAAGKSTWPGHYDISAAGHIDFGETPLQTALRETEEEIGHVIDPQKLRLLFVHRAYLIAPPEGIVENEFRWVYGLELLADTQFNFSDGEVTSVTWMPLAEFTQLTEGKIPDQIVPQGKIYFQTLLSQITGDYKLDGK